MIFTSSHKKKALSDKILVTIIEAIIILFIIFNIFFYVDGKFGDWESVVNGIGLNEIVQTYSSKSTSSLSHLIFCIFSL